MGKKKIKHLGKKRRKNKSIGGFIKKTIILLGTFISLITFIYLDKHIKELYTGVNIEESDSSGQRYFKRGKSKCQPCDTWNPRNGRSKEDLVEKVPM